MEIEEKAPKHYTEILTDLLDKLEKLVRETKEEIEQRNFYEDYIEVEEESKKEDLEE